MPKIPNPNVMSIQPRFATPVRLLAALAGLLAGTIVQAQQDIDRTKKTEGQQQEELVKLDVFTVKADPSREYGSSNVSSATRLNTPAENIPQTISVVNAALLQDIGAYAYEQAIRYTPGVTQRQNTPNASIIRGFIVGNRYRNGFLVRAYETDMANIERIEVIKGPAASIAGASESGGLVNLVTKQPNFTPAYGASLSYGSYGYLRGVVDATGSVPGVHNVAYRFIASGMSADSWRDLERTRKLVVTPSALWRISSRTELLVELEYFNSLTPSGFSTPFLAPVRNSTPAPLPIPSGVTPKVATGQWAPISTNTSGEPGMGRDAEALQLFATFKHAFTETLFFRQSVSLVDFDESLLLAGVDNNLYYGNDGMIYANRTINKNLTKLTHGRAQGDLAFKDDWMNDNVGATLLVGYDLGQDLKASSDKRFAGVIPAMNLVSPTYGLPATTPLGQTVDNASKSGSVGYFANAQISALQERIILTGGLRKDWNKARWTRNNFTGVVTNTAKTPRVDSPLYGLTVKPLKWVALYAVKSEAGAASRQVQLYPNLPLTDSRQTFTTVTPLTINKEVGAKFTFLDGNFAVNIASYKVNADGAVRTQTDLTQPGGGINVIENSNVAEGVEVEFSGNINKSLAIVGGFADTKSRASGLKPDGTPREIRGVPRTKAQLFAKYTFFAADGVTYGIRGGVVTQDKVWGSAENTYRIPAATRYDLGFDFHHGVWDAALTLENVTDEVFPQAAIAQASNSVDGPRTVYLTLGRKF